jgi:hypothetical protein
MQAYWQKFWTCWIRTWRGYCSVGEDVTACS